jgi:hypothetical protein
MSISENIDRLRNQGSTAESFPSKSVLTLQIPEPQGVTGKFEYRYFTIDENIDEYGTYEYVSGAFLKRYGPPRKVIINFRSINTIAADNVLGTAFKKEGKTVIFSSDLSKKLTSEVMLQSTGFTKYTSSVKDSQKFVLNDHSGEGITAQDAFFSMAGSLDNSFIEELRGAVENQSTLYINPTTGMPTIAAADTIPDRALENIISSEFIYDVINSSANDPYSFFSLDQQQEKNGLKSIQAASRKINDPLAMGLADYVYSAPTIKDVLSGDKRTGLAIVGLIIFKNEIVDGKKIPKNPILVTNDSETSVIDKKIKYGSDYEYSVHTLCVLRTAPDMNVLLVGSSGRNMVIECVEKKSPPPIQAIHFHWTGSFLRLSWQMPVQTNDLGGPIGDIKGYQVFYRHKITEAFRILKYIDFNDLIEAYSPLEKIPNMYTVTTELPLSNMETKIVPDKLYIFAVCTVDAHGNSSNFSTQYEVTLVSRDNALLIKMASYPGAPKQYPNFMMSGKLFVDSMAVSGVEKATIYYKPDATDLTIYKTNAKIAVESLSDDRAAYRLQMIDINSQNDNILDIKVRKLPEGK